MGKILKFESTWCEPCKVLKSIMSEVMAMDEFKTIKVIELDIDESENYDLCLKHQVRSIPTLVMLDDNDNVVNKVMGAIPKNNLIEILKQSYHV